MRLWIAPVTFCLIANYVDNTGNPLVTGAEAPQQMVRLVAPTGLPVRWQ
jgi:hypothetical protein